MAKSNIQQQYHKKHRTFPTTMSNNITFVFSLMYFLILGLGQFHALLVTARLSNGMLENNVFTGVCLSTPGGTSSPSHNTSTGPMSFSGVPQDGVPPPRTGYDMLEPDCFHTINIPVNINACG